MMWHCLCLLDQESFWRDVLAETTKGRLRLTTLWGVYTKFIHFSLLHTVEAIEVTARFTTEFHLHCWATWKGESALQFKHFCNSQVLRKEKQLSEDSAFLNEQMEKLLKVSSVPIPTLKDQLLSNTVLLCKRD